VPIHVPPIPTLSLAGDELTIIDQTLLPEEERRIAIATVEEMWEAIRNLRVRGAPAIGIAAAFGLDIAARASRATDRARFLRDLGAARAYLATARPTAVNLFWALDRVFGRVERVASNDVDELRAVVRDEAQAILREDLAAGRAMGEHGAELLRDGSVLTHCNAGGLATSGFGTALAPIFIAHAQGTRLHVYVDETRPLLQGARLTAWELRRAGVPATVIADNMAASVLATGHVLSNAEGSGQVPSAGPGHGVQAVIVGADRVAANGDVANKIGTFGLAILARYFRVPFYVAMPVSTIDMACPSGASIPIEERAADELTTFNGRRTVPDGVPVYNPAFDVTPAELVTAFITERGIVWPPFARGLAACSSNTSTPP
jgi:methylthioribose-1-phosphate isomerase